MDIGELLPVVVAHDEASGLFLDRPGRRESARGHYMFYVACMSRGAARNIWEPLKTLGKHLQHARHETHNAARRFSFSFNAVVGLAGDTASKCGTRQLFQVLDRT
jgi:hypothetical protein